MSTETVTSVGWVPGVDTFGARLALIRQRMGWNIKEAAVECGVPPQSWRQWEAGGNSRSQESVARKIALRTGCDFLWLFAGYTGPGNVAGRRVDTGVETTRYQAASGHPGGKLSQVIDFPRRYRAVAKSEHGYAMVTRSDVALRGEHANAA